MEKCTKEARTRYKEDGEIRNENPYDHVAIPKDLTADPERGSERNKDGEKMGKEGEEER